MRDIKFRAWSFEMEKMLSMAGYFTGEKKLQRPRKVCLVPVYGPQG